MSRIYCWFLSCLLVFAASESAFSQASVSEHLTMGNPSKAKADDGELTNRLIVRHQYALSYNGETGTANWVSWHLDTKWLGGEERSDDFRKDSDLPGVFKKVGPADYAKTGFDRGHICPSGDRTDNPEDNSATFVMTNMMPQAPRNNRQTWRLLEEYSRDVASHKRELYIIAGPHGVGGKGTKGFRSKIGSEVKVTVPSITWKVIIVLPKKGGDDVARVDKDTRAFGVIMPNNQSIASDWREYIVPVREVEEATDYDFFSEVPKNIQDVIELAEDEGDDS